MAAASRLRGGRAAGAFAKQPDTRSRSGTGMPSRAGAEWTTRYSTSAGLPSPNGAAPVAANASTPPSENTSPAGSGGPPSACSGDMNEGVPTVVPVAVTDVASSAREIPKSITRGPSTASSTFAGLRSRCTSPRECSACRASTSPAASRHTDAAGSGPPSATASASDGPGTNTVASHGGSSSGPAATTEAV